MKRAVFSAACVWSGSTGTETLDVLGSPVTDGSKREKKEIKKNQSSPM